MGSSKPSGSTTTVQKADPWEGQQQYLREIYDASRNLYQSDVPQYYGGQVIADQSPETLTAQNLITQRALAGSPVTGAAQGMLTDTLQGKYLNSNPYLDATFNKAADQVQGRVGGAFSQGGRYGSGLNQQVLGKELGGLATDIYGGNYQQERGRQMQGMQFAPQLANQDYLDFSQLANVGSQKEAYNQALINEDINKFNWQQQLPATKLGQYQAMVGGAIPGGSTMTQPYYSNSGAGMLGMGMQGLGMLGSLGMFGGMGGSAAGATLPWLTAAAMSDIRLKYDIHQVGMEKGLPIYHFRYKSDPRAIVYRGVMAHEVLRVMRDAVHRVGDYLAVDYRKLGINFRRAV